MTKNNNSPSVVIGEAPLSLNDIFAVAFHQKPVSLSRNPKIKDSVTHSYNAFQTAIAEGNLIYGVNSGFGGMANSHLEQADCCDLQENLLWFMQTGTGNFLDYPYVRATMLIRCCSLIQGLSGIRWELIERLVAFLNLNITPKVNEIGSIGASGDLVPLTQITAALIGLNEQLQVDINPGTAKHRTISCQEALSSHGLQPIRLHGKEALAMVNGTSASTAIAAINLIRAKSLLDKALNFHCLAIQGLHASTEPFTAFIHQHKAHPGQIEVAELLRQRLEGSQLIRQQAYKQGELAQDRYSLRCIPQFLGPIWEAVSHLEKQIMTEANAVTDNPLVDSQQTFYHGGNFLAQYIGIAMDQLRFYIGLTAKHIDTQIALTVDSHFNNGLANNLIGNPNRRVNMGLKGLQITGNSLVPTLTYLGNTYVDRFCTHAEQFNQNINSLAFGSGVLAKQSLDVFCQYLSVATIFAIQLVDLRCFQLFGHYHSLETLSKHSRTDYLDVYNTLAKSLEANEPLIKDDNQQILSHWLQALQQRIERQVLEIK